MDSTKSVKFIPYNIFTDDYCIDNFDNDTEAVNTTWFYYLKTTHLNGSVAYSDTVGYKLVNKPQLQVPANMAEYAQTDSIIFEWDKNNTNTLIQDRLLIFDDSYNLIWFYNLVADEEPLINFAEISGIELDTGGYIWRVDAVIDYYDELYLNSQKIRVHSGAESMERYFTVVD